MKIEGRLAGPQYNPIPQHTAVTKHMQAHLGRVCCFPCDCCVVSQCKLLKIAMKSSEVC